MKNTGIIYGSSTGNTETIAKIIKDKLAGLDVTLLDVAKASTGDLEKFDNLILGTSTWGLGDLQDDWDSFLPQLKKANLEGKTVALFGVGDSQSYPDTFVDGIGILYEAISDKGCVLVGPVPADGYSYDASRAFNGSEFVGLPLDEDNEGNLTEGRISSWISKIINDFK